MGFVASVFTAVVDVVVSIVETVVQVVEMVVQAVMVLLGFDGGSTQVIEYYEVHNVPLFDDVDDKNPLQQSIIQSIVSDEDIASNLLYHIAFRSLKGNVKEFMDYIDNGNYFEGFPTVESHILTVDYDEVTDVLDTINSVSCTIETAFLRALSKKDWVQSWLQDNKGYDVGANRLGTGNVTVTTSPITPASTSTQGINFNITITDEIATSDSVVIDSGSAIETSPGTPTSTYALSREFIVTITDEVATSDSVTVDQRWSVNFGTIVYNSTPDTYTVQVYQADGTTMTLPYTVPTKPTQIHYVVKYYINTVPARIYLFIYQAGSGTYTALDTIEDPIDIDGATLETLPAVPLRISNSNYTTFGATKKAAIEHILRIIHLDAEEVLDAVLTDPGVASNLGDVDNVYVNFGVRMWDTSQAGMGYLFQMFENLYPSQAITQGVYNNTPAADEQPQNNILTTTDDNNTAFQWSYITYTNTSLAVINANSGSPENGIYYSDMSKFDDNNILKYSYYSSSGKGTYNVGYKADDLDEVQDFLDGNGVTNPGTTSGEATNWLQVTTRLSYNNPTPNLLESDNSASTLIYLTPDAIYENNGSGTLRLVEQAAPETTIGQSITYYCIKPSGLDAYTVAAPIGALRVVDGDSGKFKMVKFNLGAKEDLMVPFIHTFIKDLSNTDVSKLFLAGAHVTIYIAKYEVIHHAGMSFLEALVIIVIIVVIVVWVMSTGDPNAPTALMQMMAAIGAGKFALAWTLFLKMIPTLLIKMATQMVIQLIISVLPISDELKLILNVLAAVAVAKWDPGITVGTPTYGHTGGTAIGTSTPGASIEFAGPSLQHGIHFNDVTRFSTLTGTDFLSIAASALKSLSYLVWEDVKIEAASLEQDIADWRTENALKSAEINEVIEDVFRMPNLTALVSTVGSRRSRPSQVSAEAYYHIQDSTHMMQCHLPYAYTEIIETKLESKFI